MSLPFNNFPITISSYLKEATLHFSKTQIDSNSRSVGFWQKHTKVPGKTARFGSSKRATHRSQIHEVPLWDGIILFPLFGLTGQIGRCLESAATGGVGDVRYFSD
jgi:hypothetical protein